jgi:hypothetical protein
MAKNTKIINEFINNNFKHLLTEEYHDTKQKVFVVMTPLIVELECMRIGVMPLKV